ncbi:DUF6282 family protein [Georgenia yuyongxinii]|uniref:DUF6282 family protein n=1 Tax=Georgenia yuyongxinii TaxID=2589797 RepID=UPI00163D4308|nr:DUF6282 family protein [Georgenia yuyongxinii]
MTAPARLVDFHVHPGPDSRPRKLDGVELASYAPANGVVGMVIKSHTMSTVAAAALLEKVQPGLRVAGGIALNRAAGGINPDAVDASIRAGGKVVWFPTQDSENERHRTGASGGTVSVWGECGELSDEVHLVLTLCAEADQVVCSGHLAPDEVLALFDAAQGHRVERFVVSHPDHRHIDMPLSLQEELAHRGAVMERVIPRPEISDVDVAEMAARIRAVGVGRNVLGSDLGQPHNPPPPAGLRAFADQLSREGGLGSDDLESLALITAAELLDWEIRS